MNMRNTLRALPLLLLYPAGTIAAPLTINFLSSLVTARQGQTVTFSASITNGSAATVFLNSDSLNVAAPLTVDDTKFFLNSPISLLAGQTSLMFQIFDVSVPLGTPLGLYSGNLDILGGADGNAFDPVGSAAFAVTVVPEPSTGALAFAWLAGAGALMRRRRCRR